MKGCRPVGRKLGRSGNRQEPQGVEEQRLANGKNQNRALRPLPAPRGSRSSKRGERGVNVRGG